MKRSGARYSNYAPGLGVPELPNVAMTLSGVQFDPSSDIWEFRDGIDQVRIDFRQLRHNFSPDILTSYKAVLMHAALEVAPQTLISYSKGMYCFAMCAANVDLIDKIGIALVSGFWSSPIYHEKTKFDFRALVFRWNDQRYSGIDEEALVFLRRQRTKPTIFAESVLTWDPITGPLTDNEFKSYYEGLTELYADDIISTELFLMAWLTTSLGVRPRQIALLKVSDIRRINEPSVVRYSLSMPRIKQRGQTPRDEMYEWPVLNEIGKLLFEHASKQKAFFQKVLVDSDLAPLFSCNSKIDSVPSQSKSVSKPLAGNEGEKQYDDDVVGECLEFHVSSGMIVDRLKIVFDRIHVASERLEDGAVLSARRLRKTYGTRLAAENVPGPVIAKMLGHRDIRSGKPYIAATSRLQDRLDKALAFELAPLAQAFRGELLLNSDEEKSSAIVRDLKLVPSGEQLGKCGKSGYCGYAAPIACYTCKKFRPWKDAPHEAIFDFLWAKREKRLTSQVENDAHMTMLHDRTIFAVAQVILICNEHKDI